MIKKALEILHDYCYSNEHCDTCIFNDCRDDLDACKVNQLVDDERYINAVKEVE